MSVLTAIWLSPAAAVIWALYIGPLCAMRLIRPTHRLGSVVVFRKQPGPRLWERLWEGWFGHAMPFAILVDGDDYRRIRHELRHCQQWRWLGALFPVAYLAMLILFGYARHPLEVDAENWAWERT